MLARTPKDPGIEIIEDLQKLGFDYIELSLATIAAFSHSEFEILQSRLLSARLQCEACNNFFPPWFRLTGPERDLDALLAYAVPAMTRAAALGTKIIVFGSGPAKMVPEGFPKIQAWDQLTELLRALSGPAETLGLTLAIEPLRAQECNIINTAAEGLALVHSVREKSVQLLVDYFHLSEEKEDCRILEVASSHLVHLHLANPKGRIFPSPADGCEYTEFFDTLARIGYLGRISIEAYSNSFSTDAKQSLVFLKRLFVESYG